MPNRPKTGYHSYLVRRDGSDKARDQPTTLEQAIDNAEDVDLRRVLKQICKDSEACRSEVMKRMLIARKHEVVELMSPDREEGDGDGVVAEHSPSVSAERKRKRIKKEEDEDDDDDDIDDERPRKRHGGKRYSKTIRDDVLFVLVPRFETCVNCHREYDVTANADDSCQVHPGQLEMRFGAFPDDEDLQTQLEIELLNPYEDRRREEFPDQFIWKCCGKESDGQPCYIQEHIPVDKCQQSRWMNWRNR